MKGTLIFIFALLFGGQIVLAQHEHPAPAKKDPPKTTQPKPVVNKKTPSKKILKKITPSKPVAVKKDSLPTDHSMHFRRDSINKLNATKDSVHIDHKMHANVDTVEHADPLSRDTVSPSHNMHSKKDTVPVEDKHAGHKMPVKSDTIPGAQDIHGDHQMDGMRSMSHAYSRNLPMNRNGSGTSWMPDETPMYMYMTGKKIKLMLHGNVFLRYTNTDIFNKGNRGSDDLDAPNWFMGMLNRPLGSKGLLSAKLMLSLDPLTEGGNGYPLLFQSGETHNGQRLVDRQHPHDLFSELSVGYSYAFNKNTDLFAYLGFPGEPALGAPAFMHRVSTMNNPDAPLGHHWQDATHITFGIGTLAFRYREFKAEGSVFTGREPDEDRYDFDEPLFDSYSFRLSFNPTKNWAMQFSRGFINSPELLEPGIDVTRTTASVLFARNNRKNMHYTAALVWGYNDSGKDHQEHSLLFEDNYQIGKNSFFKRYEFIQKSAEELDLENEFGEQTFNVHALSLGYNRILVQKNLIEFAAGMQTTLNFPDSKLKPLYGNLPVGLQFYLQLRPSWHKH